MKQLIQKAFLVLVVHATTYAATPGEIRSGVNLLLSTDPEVRLEAADFLRKLSPTELKPYLREIVANARVLSEQAEFETKDTFGPASNSPETAARIAVQNILLKAGPQDPHVLIYFFDLRLNHMESSWKEHEAIESRVFSIEKPFSPAFLVYLMKEEDLSRAVLAAEFLAATNDAIGNERVFIELGSRLHGNATDEDWQKYTSAIEIFCNSHGATFPTAGPLLRKELETYLKMKDPSDLPSRTITVVTSIAQALASADPKNTATVMITNRLESWITEFHDAQLLAYFHTSIHQKLVLARMGCPGRLLASENSENP